MHLFGLKVFTSQSLFDSKVKVLYLSCVIYKGLCSCDAYYIGETIRNVNIRWNEHESGIDKYSEWTKTFKNISILHDRPVETGGG